MLKHLSNNLLIEGDNLQVSHKNISCLHRAEVFNLRLTSKSAKGKA